MTLPTIAICSWAFGHHRYPEIASVIRQLGCSGVELLLDIEANVPAHINQIFSSEGISIISMTPKNVDITDIEVSNRHNSINYYQRLLDFAAELGSPAITIHEFIGRHIPADDGEEEWERLVSSMIILAKYAEVCEVDLLLEPLSYPLVSQIVSVKSAYKLAQIVNSKRLRIVLDTYHMSRTVNEDPILAISLAASRLAAVQVSDSHRQGLGLGSINLNLYMDEFSRAGFIGPWIIESVCGIKAPSLSTQLVDQDKLYFNLKTSANWLRSRFMSTQ